MPLKSALAAGDIVPVVSAGSNYGFDLGTVIARSVTPQQFGAVGDGIADDTLALRAAFDAVRLAGGGEVFVPAGTYKVTRIPHPTQPYASPFLPSGGVGAILRLGDNCVLRGEGMDRSIIKGIFPWQSAGADLTKSMTLINHGNNFTMEDIWVRGDYPEASPASFVLIPSNNGNSLIAATPASNIPIIGQHIRRCRLSHAPGFSVGTAEVLHATFEDNEVLFCANGYNVSGGHIMIARNYWFALEGVESAGSDASRIEAYHDPGSIQVIGNVFEEVTVACSLGGNGGVGAGSVSRGYVVVGNEVKSLLHSSSGGAIIIAPNATEVIVSGNVVYGKFAEGVICTLSGSPAGTSPDAISIIGNRIHLTTTDAKGIFLDMEAGKVATVQGNRVKIDSGGSGVHATNAGTYYISENTLEARDAGDISNATGTIWWDFRTNKHIPTDATYATRLLAGLDTFSGTITSFPGPIDPASGFKVPLSNLVRQWDGEMVDRRFVDKRNPQDFVRGRADEDGLPFARPEAPDRFSPRTSSGKTRYMTQQDGAPCSKKGRW
jgi:hypothetical protein